MLSKLEQQAREILAGRGISYDIMDHWKDVAKLVALAKAMENWLLHGMGCTHAEHCAVNNYMENYPCDCGYLAVEKTLDEIIGE